MAQRFTMLELYLDDDNLAAEMKISELLHSGDSFIESLSDQPTNPNRIPAIGKLALDPDYLFGSE